MSSSLGRIAFVDVHYAVEARAACIVAATWTDSVAIDETAVSVENVQAYTSGRFFERELPCVVAALDAVHTDFEVIVVDGYVFLDADGSPGLGAHLHSHYRGEHPVVGVAKTPYRGSAFATPVTRGTSLRPLYVTAIGVDVDEAAAHVAAMHGDHRIPTLLRRVDRLSRMVGL